MTWAALLGFFFLNDTAPTEIYTLSLHDALPILRNEPRIAPARPAIPAAAATVMTSIPSAMSLAPAHRRVRRRAARSRRSEEHTSELQSRQYLVCRLLLEKKKN